MAELEVLMSSPEKLGQYVGAWIAVVGNRIIAVGESAKEVYDKAIREHPDAEPFVTKLPREKVMLL